jgi:DNA-binding transcriptional ArsR family regulator
MSVIENTYGDSPSYLSLYQTDDEALAQRPTLCQFSYALGQIPNLPPKARRIAELIYERLRRDCNLDICCYLSEAYIARNLGMAERSVRRHIRRFEQLGLFEVEYLGRDAIRDRVYEAGYDIPIADDELPDPRRQINVYYPVWDGGGFLGIWPTNTFLRPSVLNRPTADSSVHKSESSSLFSSSLNV